MKKLGSRRLISKIALRIAVSLLVCASATYAQSSGRTQRAATPCSAAVHLTPCNGGGQWQNNRVIQQALAHSVQTPKVGVAGQFNGSSNSALDGLLRKQSAAARALLVSAVRPASSTQSRAFSGSGSAQPLLRKSTAPQIGVEQTMSAPRASGSSASSPHNAVPQGCPGGIAAVDGQKSGTWFSPLPGPEGTFVIQGCGFGTGGGVVYLSGLHFAPQARTATQAFAQTPAPSSGPAPYVDPAVGAAAGGLIGVLAQQQLLGPPARDRIVFQVSSWSDRQIVAQIDPNARGFYDTNNVSLVVKTTGGQQYQAGGFNFSAARETQSLTAIPNASSVSGIHLAKVADSFGDPVLAIPESPSVSFLQNHTIAVMRNRVAASLPAEARFAGGTDTYQFKFAPGFQIAPQGGVQLYTAKANPGDCQSINGRFSTSGTWAVNYSSTSSFDISWEEQACLPGPAGGNPLNFGSVSAYALEITVIGPKGVSPWPAGNLTSITTQKSTQLLHNH